MVGPFMPDDEKLAAVRDGLPAVAAGIYLSTAAAGPLPAETAKAMGDLQAWELATGRAHPAAAEESLVRMDEARAAVAAILTADVDSIGLTHGATDAMNLGAWAVDWHEGDTVVTTRHEHPGGLGALYALRDRFGVELVFVDVPVGADGADADRVVDAFEAAITPRTRLVAISHVLSTTGALLPIARIGELVRAADALFLVDGAQSAGAMPVALGELGVDLYAVSGHKWLLGPEGIGAIYCSPAALGRARPSRGGPLAFESVDPSGTGVWWPDARRFQAANYHRPSVVGLARSCGWLSMYVGLDWIHRRGIALAATAARRIAGIAGVEMLTPLDAMATIVTFRIRGWAAEAALDELGARVFAIAGTVSGHDAIRIGIGFFNTEDEIERFVEAVALLAGHTPDTLPPRRRLSVLGMDP